MFDSIELARIGKTVRSTINRELTGKIVGYGFVDNELKYLVSLGMCGFASADYKTYVDCLVMDPSNCEEVASEFVD